jgi:hypothetical protein
MTAWTEAAMSMYSTVICDSGSRRWQPNNSSKAVRRRLAVEITEERRVEAVGAVLAQIDQPVEDEVDVARLAVGGQPHQLVLAGIDLEPAMVGEGAVQETERMRVVDLPQRRDAAVVAGGERRRGPFADTVGDDDGRLAKRRGVKRRGGVRQVVIDEEHIVAGAGRQELPQPLGDIQRLAQLRARRRRPGLAGIGGELDRVLDDAVERQDGVFVEHDGVERFPAAGRVEAIGDRRLGIAAVVLSQGEALLLRRGEDLAIAHHRRCGIVIEAGDAEDRRHAERACNSGGAAAARPAWSARWA